MLIWVLAGVVAVLLTFIILAVAALVDEDVNHWFWPNENRPGLAWNIRWGLLSAAGGTAVALGPVIVAMAYF